MNITLCSTLKQWKKVEDHNRVPLKREHIPTLCSEWAWSLFQQRKGNYLWWDASPWHLVQLFRYFFISWIMHSVYWSKLDISLLILLCIKRILFFQGVPCSDGKHCCHKGHKCSEDGRFCIGETGWDFWQILTDVWFWKVNITIIYTSSSWSKRHASYKKWEPQK